MNLFWGHIGRCEVTRQHGVDGLASWQRTDAGMFSGVWQILLFNECFKLSVRGRHLFADNAACASLYRLGCLYVDRLGHSVENTPERAVLRVINNECVELLWDPLDDNSRLRSLTIDPLRQEGLVLS